MHGARANDRKRHRDDFQHPVERPRRTVSGPQTDDVALKGGAVKLDAMILYADLCAAIKAAWLEESPVGRTRGAAGFAPRALADVYA